LPSQENEYQNAQPDFLKKPTVVLVDSPNEAHHLVDNVAIHVFSEKMMCNSIDEGWFY
jgi:hypothetical protein